MKRTLVLALLAACGGPAATKPIQNPTGPTAPAELKTAEAVIEASIAHEGGRAAFGKLTSLHMTGTLNIAQLGVPGKLETWSTPPNNTYTRFEAPNVMVDESGVTGDIAWEKNTLQGARVLSGPERSAELRDSVFAAETEWKRLYPKTELKGVVKFADMDCYQVVLTAADGQTVTRYYAKDSLLPVGVEMVSESQMGKIPVKVVQSDWRETGGIKFPHKVSRVEAAQAIDVVIDTIEVNVPVPPDKFAISDDIKKLAAAAPK